MMIENTVRRLPIKSKNTKLFIGALTSGIIAFFAIYVGFICLSPVFGLAIQGKEITIVSFIGSGFIAIITAMYISRILQMSQEFDERFSLHYLKIKSISEGITIFGMLLWLSYEKIVNNNVLWPIFIIWGIAILARFIALRYYQQSN